MIADDDGIQPRQSSRLLRNTNLSSVSYRTEIFNVSQFASVQFYLSPTAGSTYPVYVTIEWWLDAAMSNRVATDVVTWAVVGDFNSRRWTGAIPCRADYMSITLDTPGAADLSMVVIGSSRTVATITQQVNPNGAAGGPPFALVYNNQTLPVGPSNGASVFVPPWFGEIEIAVYTNCPSGVSTYLLVYDVGGSNTGTGVDCSIISLENNVGGCYTALLANTRWNKQRFAVNGQAIRLLGGNTGPAAGVMIVSVQPITGRG